MKFKIVEFRIFQEIEGRAVFPADATEDYIESVLRKTADDEVGRWDVREWEHVVHAVAPVDISATSCQRENSFFQKEDTFVVDLQNKVLATPEDTDWWIATEAEKAEETNQLPVEPNQLPLLDLSFKAIFS